ncbi:deoxycytidyl transferase [Kappamyces sp. JEL0829]|nr:deoxycytidyl transferase [Kappamyces sp. JEL0829]
MAFRGFGDYMAVKKAKLQAQSALLTAQRSSIFSGCAFYLNGYLGSEWTFIDLKDLIISHGGHVYEHLSSKCTHILATSMTAAKMTRIKLQPIVKPDWIHDSIKASKLLPLDVYRLVRADLDPKQTRLGQAWRQNHGPVEEEDRESDEEPDHYELEERQSRTRKPDLDYTNENIRAQICTAPGFLERYFSSSRLHHLSTWKGELIDFVAGEMQSRNMTAKKRGKDAVIMHVDMDCFFASVALRHRPELRDRPVVVAHNTDSGDASSTSQIASCNYVARAMGISNGMFLGPAYEITPDIVVLSYDFEAIVACTNALYQVLIEHSDFVQAVSCDEAVVDLTDTIRHSGMDRELACRQHAERLRKDIFAATNGCCASVGIGFNMLSARLATHKAKPDGVFYMSTQNLPGALETTPVSKLPGVGWRTVKLLQEMKIETCGKLQEQSLHELQQAFGQKQGETLFGHCRGIDNRVLENKKRQSVGVECNWAVRFQTQTEVKEFVFQLALEVFKRLQASKMAAAHLTVKAKKRNYVGEPGKFLGCGRCIDYSKSMVSKSAYSSANMLFRDAYNLIVELQIPPSEIRGLGIHLKKKQIVLENGQRTLSFSGIGKAAVPASERQPAPATEPPSPTSRKAREFEKKYGMAPGQVDVSVLQCLPPELRQELCEAGFGALAETSRTKRPANPIVDEWGITTSQIDPDVLRQLPRVIQMEQKAAAAALKRKRQAARSTSIGPGEDGVAPVRVASKPRLLAEEDSSVIMDHIKEWTALARQGDVPQEEDVGVLSSYLVELVHDLKMDRAVYILRYMALHLGLGRSKGKCSHLWAAAFDTILAAVNKCVQSLYGSPIAQECIFSTT